MTLHLADKPDLPPCYADTFIPKAEKQRAKESGDDPQRIGFLKRYTVFNADHCEGLDPLFFEGVTPLPPREIVPIAETLIKATGADFRIRGDKAFCVPSEDFRRNAMHGCFADAAPDSWGHALKTVFCASNWLKIVPHFSLTNYVSYCIH